MTRRLAIALITYQRPGGNLRTEYALRTIRAIAEFLHLKDGDIGWYLADDGSPDEHYSILWSELAGLSQAVIGTHHERLGPGISQNRAAAACFEWAPVTLWMEDDWVLKSSYDVTRHYDFVSNPPDPYDVRMVRLAYLTSNTVAKVIGYDWQHYLLMSRTTQYSFSGHPALRHRKWWEVYGPYCDSSDAGHCEIDMDGRWRAQPGPEIVWPVDSDGYGHFDHIGGEKA